MIVAKLDRLSRSVADFVNLQGRAQSQGWTLQALDLPTDASTPMGEAMGTMMATFAQLERRMIATRTAEAMQAAKARGSRLGPPRSNRSNALAVRVEGLRSDGLTFQAIADTLNAEGLPTLRGGAEWRPSNVQALLRLRRLDREAEEARAGEASKA
jgi:DNA invertase Pin-like site-specific DNA recombinase